jgi:hypothetical protein
MRVSDKLTVEIIAVIDVKEIRVDVDAKRAPHVGAIDPVVQRIGIAVVPVELRPNAFVKKPTESAICVRRTSPASVGGVTDRRRSGLRRRSQCNKLLFLRAEFAASQQRTVIDTPHDQT